jgi:formamidopyrimidine-DNA glycosylase
MPELPEIETIRRGLTTLIKGKKITGLKILTPKTFIIPEELAQSIIVGEKLTGFDRFGKVLVWNLANKYSLLFHLKMTGQVVVVEPDGQRFVGGHPSTGMTNPLPDNSTRIIFTLDSGETVYFNDQRKFGWIKLEQTADVVKDSLITRLGPEPLSEDFKLKDFAAVLKRHGRSPVKAVILDQSTVAGVGNIYADESLHLAKIHPARLAGELTSTEVKRLHGAIITIIGNGITQGGTSFSKYVNALGGKGNYLDVARVFRREGEPCPVCGTIIKKIRVAGRGTHYCPKCQKLK